MKRAVDRAIFTIALACAQRHGLAMRNPPLHGGTLIQRYKRFLADVRLDTGETVTAHCANPGAMLGLCAPGARMWLSRSADPKRKLAWSWLYVETDFGCGAPQLVGIDTTLPNRLAGEALRAGSIPELAGYATIRPEVRYGVNSRIDFLLDGEGRPPCHVEIKNVHFMRRPGLAEFPDCRTERGAKHLRELAAVARAGGRAVMLYVLQMQAAAFTLARDIDPAYAAAFDAALADGVEAIAYCCSITTDSIALHRPVPVVPHAPQA